MQSRWYDGTSRRVRVASWDTGYIWSSRFRSSRFDGFCAGAAAR